jgi:hypothetical protein
MKNVGQIKQTMSQQKQFLAQKYFVKKSVYLALIFTVYKLQTAIWTFLLSSKNLLDLSLYYA